MISVLGSLKQETWKFKAAWEREMAKPVDGGGGDTEYVQIFLSLLPR